MNASVAFSWRNAEMLVLAPLYGNKIDAVLSRSARKPVQSSGIPIPTQRAAVRAA